LAVSGNSSVGGTLAITGATTTTTIVSSGIATLSGTLAVTGATTFAADASLNSKLTVLGDVSMNSKLFVGGDVSLNSRLFVGGDVSLNSALSIVGATTLTNTTINSTLTVTGATTVPSLNVLGNLTGTTLDVTGQSILNGDISMNSKLIVIGNVTMNSKLAVTGATTISALNVTSNAIVGGTLGVTGNTRFDADVSMNSTALVAGDVSLNSNLSVSTNTAIGGTLRVTGATAASSTLAVTGAATVGGTLGVAGRATFAANATFNGNLDISGNLSVRSNTILALANIQTKQEWKQLGETIFGEERSDNSGWSIALSKDGNTLAIGGIYNDGTTNNVFNNHGSVRVYRRDITNTTIFPIGWAKLGQDIDGEFTADYFGCSVAISRNGRIIAIGAYYNDGTQGTNPNFADSGSVRVYELVSNVWTQIGKDIDGERRGDWSGFSVALSDNGSILAIGATKAFNQAESGEIGHVRIYENISNNWTQKGGDIDGETFYSNCGYSVALSGNGLIVAIGSINNDGTVINNQNDNRGSVSVYQYNSNKLVAVTNQTSSSFGPVGWDRLGQDIDGVATQNNWGWSVSLSNDGSILAIGAATNLGRVRVFKRDVTNTTIVPFGWTQFGGNIDGINGSGWGYSVSLTDDGYTVAIGANTSSTVSIYKINTSGNWTLVGDIITGLAGIQFGFSVSISGDGTIVAASSPYDDGTNASTNDKGSVRVYNVNTSTYTNAPLVSSDLITTGNAIVSGALSVTSSTAISSTLSVSGATTLTSLTTSRNAAFSSTLQVTGATTMTTLQVTGATAVTSLAATGNAVIGGTLVVTGATTMTSLNVSGLIKKR